VTLDRGGHFDPRACGISPARLRRADRPGKHGVRQTWL